jgi:zinc protease
MRLLFVSAALSASLFGQAAAPAKPAAPKAVAPKMPVAPYQTLRFPTLKEVKIPEVTQFTLPNGMRVFLVENRELPLISGFALVRTGNLFDPKDKIGLADIAGTVMRTGGTKAKTGDQLNEQLENIAASVESQIGETNGRVSFNCLKENAAEVMEVFRDVLTQPEFRQDKLDLAKTQEKSGISRRNDDPGSIAQREFSDVLYGKNTPFGWRMEYATIDAITREDLVKFHQRYFFPKNTLLAVQGDFDTAAMRAQIEKVFAGWTAEQPPVPEFPKVDMTPRPGIYLAKKDDVNQTTFRLGHLAGTLRDKDYPALEVMASVLGGSPFTSRLGSAIRVQRGYAYQIGAAWAAQYNHPGVFLVVAGTKSANTVDAIKTVQSEIEKFRSAEPTDAELKSAKDKILNTFVFNFDNPSKTLSRLVSYEYYGYPKDFIFQYQKAVEAVTKADVLRVAKEHLKPENFAYVLVGKPADFGTPLSSLGLPVTEIDLTIPEPKREATQATPETLQRGRQLLAKMAQAMGGADKLKSIRDLSRTVDVEINAGGATIQAKQKVSWVAPMHYRQDSELPFGKLSAYFDGQTGWMKAPQGEMALAGPALKQMQEQVFHDLVNLARSGEVAGRTVNLAGDGAVEIAENGMTTRLFLDEASGLPVRQVYTGAAMGGAPSEVEEIYNSFADVNGVKLPSSVTVMQGGKKFAENKVTASSINAGLKVEDLAKKP